MKKNYKVLVTASAIVLVIGAEDERGAVDLAIDNTRLGDLKNPQCTVQTDVLDKDVRTEREKVDVTGGL
jgi:hypothetical protein